MEGNLGVMGVRAINFVKSFREHHEDCLSGTLNPTAAMSWKPPVIGHVKLNFDGACLGGKLWGWGFVVRNHDGDIILARAKHGDGFPGALVEEARACLFSLENTYNMGIKNITIEGDCLSLIEMLRSDSVHKNVTGYFVSDILSFVFIKYFL